MLRFSWIEFCLQWRTIETEALLCDLLIYIVVSKAVVEEV